MLTGNKNVDLYEILMNLDDESLLNFCKSAVKQEYEKSLCVDETFWKLRTQKYYPLAYDNKNLRWKKLYLRKIYKNKIINFTGKTKYFVNNDNDEFNTKMLTGNKDIDLYKILMNLDDESLLNFCKSAVKQEYEKSLCVDETFWKLRTKNYYPLIYENKKLEWKDYYLRIVYYKDKMEKEYDFNFTDGDAKDYYDILKYVINVKENDKIFIDFLLKNKNEFNLKIDKYKDLNQFLKKFQYYEILHDDYDYSNTFLIPLAI